MTAERTHDLPNHLRYKPSPQSHLVSSYPDMVSGLVNPLKNQKDAKFIDARQAALGTYLDRLLHMAKVRTGLAWR